jgi:uncharacterized protein (UPF0264 family)
MTLKLASVTDAEEAETAVQHGGDIIDVKDVGGAFGTAAPALVRATVDAVAQRRPISAVVGEPQIRPEALARAAKRGSVLSSFDRTKPLGYDTEI